MLCNIARISLFFQKHECNAVPIISSGSHRHNSNVVRTESKFLDEVILLFRGALTRAQELFIERSGRGIAFNNDGSILRKPQKVCHHGIQLFSSGVREFLRTIRLDDEQFVLPNPGTFLCHILLKFLGLILDWREASEIIEAAVLEK